MVQVIRADLDEIVFENREKQYGGYVLRKNYHKYLTFGLLIMLTITALGVAVPFIYAQMQQISGIARETDGEHIFENLPKTKDKEKLPEVLPPPPPPPPVVETPPAAPEMIAEVAVKTPVPKPVEEVKTEETIHNIDEMDNKAISHQDKDGTNTSNENAVALPDGEPNGTRKEPIVIQEPPATPKPNVETPQAQNTVPEPSSTIFVAASKQPKEVNLGDIQKMVEYPAVAREMGWEEKVVFRVLLDENGNYVRHIAPKNAKPIFVKVVEEHISKVKFTPALQGNTPIKFWVNVPFNFQLQ